MHIADRAIPKQRYAEKNKRVAQKVDHIIGIVSLIINFYGINLLYDIVGNIRISTIFAGNASVPAELEWNVNSK